MKDKFEYIFNKILFLIKSILYVTIIGLIAVLLGEFAGWLFNLFVKF